MLLFPIKWFNHWIAPSTREGFCSFALSNEMVWNPSCFDTKRVQVIINNIFWSLLLSLASMFWQSMFSMNFDRPTIVEMINISATYEVKSQRELIGHLEIWFEIHYRETLICHLVVTKCNDTSDWLSQSFKHDGRILPTLSLETSLSQCLLVVCNHFHAVFDRKT